MPADATLTLAAAPVLLLAAAEPVAVPWLLPPLVPVGLPLLPPRVLVWPAGMKTEPLVVPACVPPRTIVVDDSTLIVNEVRELLPL